MNRIDSHCHLWRIAAPHCHWPTAGEPALYRDFELPELEALARRSGMSGCVLVQSQEDEDDTRWLLEIAATSRFVKGVVGWLDLQGRDAPRRIAAFAGVFPKLVGLRPMLQDQPADWLLPHLHEDVITAMEDADLVFEALVRPMHLAELACLAERHPRLSVVIDHAAKPEAGAPAGWHADMARLAALPNVACKLSGLLTETPASRDAAATALGVIDLFGAERVIWGSDWPVLNTASDYASWEGLARELVPATAHEVIFGGNAARIYGLKP